VAFILALNRNVIHVDLKFYRMPVCRQLICLLGVVDRLVVIGRRHITAHVRTWAEYVYVVMAAVVCKSPNFCKCILNTQSSVRYSYIHNRYSTSWDFKELCKMWNFRNMVAW
jgi:hypothetical protein